MPELPEVEIMRCNVERWTTGRRLLRFVSEDPKLDGLSIQPGPVHGVYRRGKALVWVIDRQAILIHFRMTGKMVQWSPNRRYCRAKFEMSEGMTLAFLDQRRFAEIHVMSITDIDDYFLEKGWGPEPWPTPLSAEWWENRSGSLNMPLKPALMRADRVAGIGNILASEICHAAGILPQRKCRALTTNEWTSISKVVVPLIDRVIQNEFGPEISYA